MGSSPSTPTMYISVVIGESLESLVSQPWAPNMVNQ